MLTNLLPHVVWFRYQHSQYQPIARQHKIASTCSTDYYTITSPEKRSTMSNIQRHIWHKQNFRLRVLLLLGATWDYKVSQWTLLTLTHIHTWCINVTHVNLISKHTKMCCVCLFNLSVNFIGYVMCTQNPLTKVPVTDTMSFAHDSIQWQVLYTIHCIGSHKHQQYYLELNATETKINVPYKPMWLGKDFIVIHYFQYWTPKLSQIVCYCIVFY